MVASRIDAFIGSCRLGMIVNHPHTRACGIHTVAAGTQREIDTLRRTYIKCVARDPGIFWNRITVKIRQRWMMTMRVKINCPAADIEDAKLRRLAGLHDDRAVSQREWEGTAIEQEDVRHAQCRIVFSMHPFFDLARIRVSRGNAVEPAVEVHVNEG